MKKTNVSGDDASMSDEKTVYQTDVSCDNDKNYQPLNLATIKEFGFKHCQLDIARFYLTKN